MQANLLLVTSVGDDRIKCWCCIADGMIGSNAYRVTPRQNFSDGLWHMLTITTVPSGSEVSMLILCGFMHEGTLPNVMAWGYLNLIS